MTPPAQPIPPALTKTPGRKVVGAASSSCAGNTWLNVVCDDGSTWSKLNQHGTRWEECSAIPGSQRMLDDSAPWWIRGVPAPYPFDIPQKDWDEERYAYVRAQQEVISPVARP